MTWRIWTCHPAGWWWIPEASLHPGGWQISDMISCVSSSVTGQLQNFRPSSAGARIDQEEVNLSSLRRWSSTDVTFSLWGALSCAEVWIKTANWWRVSELSTGLFPCPQCSAGPFDLESYQSLGILLWGTTRKLVVNQLFGESVCGCANCIPACGKTPPAAGRERYNVLNRPLLNNGNVQYLWHRGTNKVSISCDLNTCFFETSPLILYMECKEWIQLTQWQQKHRFWWRIRQ